MKKYILISLSVILIIAAGISYNIYAKRLHPVIKNHGVVFEIPYAVEYPDSTMDYKIVVDIGFKNVHPEKLYEPFEMVSRMYNLHVLGGVKKEKLDVVIAVWGEPISVLLNDEAYHKEFGVDNPNTAVLKEMKDAGIHIIGCGQSVNRFNIDPKDLNPVTTIALSRFTAISTYQMKGYGYIKM